MITEQDKQNKLFIKIGGHHIKEIDRNILSENEFDIDFEGHYKVRVSNDNGIFRVSEAMNGYGDNCFGAWQDKKVTFLTELGYQSILGRAASPPLSSISEEERYSEEDLKQAFDCMNRKLGFKEFLKFIHK